MIKTNSSYGDDQVGVVVGDSQGKTGKQWTGKDLMKESGYFKL